MKDNLAIIGSEWTAPTNVTIRGEGATWRMWKHDYQCTPCPPQPAGAVPCALGFDIPCPKCDPKSKLYNLTECYAVSEWRYGSTIHTVFTVLFTAYNIFQKHNLKLLGTGSTYGPASILRSQD